MTIGQIANGEVGSSVRAKLNAVISLVGGGGTTPYTVGTVLFADSSGYTTFDATFTFNSSTDVLSVPSITLSSDPTIALGAATKQYVDSLVGGGGVLRLAKGVQKTSISSGSETTIVTAGSSGVFNDVYGLVITNKSATAVTVDIKDATTGTTRMTIAAPAGDTRGFMVDVASAMIQATAANNWTATVSSAVSSIEITALYASH